MNTIFKFYTCAWFMLHAHGFWLLSRVLGKFYWIREIGAGWYVVQLVVFVSLFYFTGRAVPLRKDIRKDEFDNPVPIVMPSVEGLSVVDGRFPGSANTIKDLRALPQGVVLEAQGNAYDYTTFVSTLANQQSYLGWANHVGLLTKNSEEVARRERFTEGWYKEPNCEKKKSSLKGEGIRYVVLGSLERKKYGELRAEWFACLKKVAEYKEYVLLVP